MNVVAMTGWLRADPDREETTKGGVTNFRIGSEDSPRVWVNVECWGHLAGTCAAHLLRGRHVAVTGCGRGREAHRAEHPADVDVLDGSWMS